MNNNKSTSGIGVCGVLTILFVTLKLLKLINWSWVWVLAPFWIPTIIEIIVLIIIYIKWR